MIKTKEDKRTQIGIRLNQAIEIEMTRLRLNPQVSRQVIIDALADKTEEVFKSLLTQFELAEDVTGLAALGEILIESLASQID